MKKIIFGTVAIAALVFSSDLAFAKSVTVKSGDTLYSISKANQMNVDELKKINKLSSNNIFVGQVLDLETKSAPVEKDIKPLNPIIKETQSYTVSRGDTLYRIALNHQVSVANIKKWNNLATDSIFVGQNLKVSVTAGTPIIEKPVTTEPPVEKDVPTATVPDNIVETPTESNLKYKVVSGDTLYRIATKNNISVETLRNLNKLKSDVIYIGQVLNISPNATTPVTKPNVQNILEDAKSLIGVKYLWGGTTINGFDCSGFVQYVLEKHGITVPRTSQQMWSVGTKVEQPNEGDLVFFDTSGGASHVGFFLGNNKFIGAQSSTGVAIADMDSTYWKTRYLGANSIY